MPLKIPNNLPAIEILEKENIFVMSDLRANEQDIRPLKVLILNLMPIKVTTETDFVRLLSNNPLQVEIDFLKIDSHISKNTSEEHLAMFYKSFDEVKNSCYDGMIITGAPVEMLSFEEVTYWDEITSIFDWARKSVTSTLYICWGAQAALYHFYGVQKESLNEKMFGVFKHTVNDPMFPLFRGFDDEFYIPHSRHTTVTRKEIQKKSPLKILAESNESGIGIVSSRGGREFYLTGHSEYSPYTLHDEYVRDIEKGMKMNIPNNYYKDDNPDNEPIIRWRGHGNLLFNNWLNYFVYQKTPFEIEKIKELGSLANPS